MFQWFSNSIIVNANSRHRRPDLSEPHAFIYAEKYLRSILDPSLPSSLQPPPSGQTHTERKVNLRLSKHHTVAWGLWSISLEQSRSLETYSIWNIQSGLPWEYRVSEDGIYKWIQNEYILHSYIFKNYTEILCPEGLRGLCAQICTPNLIQTFLVAYHWWRQRTVHDTDRCLCWCPGAWGSVHYTPASYWDVWCPTTPRLKCHIHTAEIFIEIGMKKSPAASEGFWFD